MKRVLLSALAASVSLGAPWETSARADDAAGANGKAAAQVLFEQARALLEQGDFARACPKFVESQKLDPGIGTLLWLADCYENNGQTASAWAAFKEAAAAAALRHDARERVARDRAEGLQPKLATLTINVAAEARAEGLDVRRDGLPVGENQWALPVPVDPGSHTLAATAPGKRPWSAQVQVPRTPGPLDLTVPPLETAAAPSSPGNEGDASDAPDEAEAEAPFEPSPSGATQRRVGIAVAGAGVLTAAVGALFAFKAKATYDDSNQGGLCVDNRCRPEGKNDRDDARTLAAVATVALGVGAAAAVGGVVLFFTAPHDAAPAVTLGPTAQGAAMRLSLVW